MEATLLKIATGADKYPLPGRSIRCPAARCYVALYTRGETRTLFETMLALLKIAGEPKVAERDVRVCVRGLPATSLMLRSAALHCVGEIMGALGAQVRRSR